MNNEQDRQTHHQKANCPVPCESEIRERINQQCKTKK